jgi:MFS transporter, DHA1 family, multidrug/chloramphenicol efflux transport protein
MAEPLINITRKQALVFACFLVLYEFLTYIANDMIMPGMLKVVESFHAPESAIASSLTAYILGGASLQLVLGPLSDRFGRRPVMLAGALLFFLCTMLIACANSIDQFLIARFLQGMGLCFICVVGYATLQEIFAEMDAIRLISIMGNISITAPLIGPLLGAVFIHYYSWRPIFALIGAFALLALWGLWRYMPEPLGQTKRNGELIQQISLSPGVVFNNYKNLFLDPSVMLGSIALGLMVLPCLVWIALSPVILITDAKLSAIQYGLWQLPIFGAAILGNWFLQRLTHHSSVKKILFLGSIILGIGLLATFILPLVFSNHYLWLIPGLIVYFFGIGVTAAPLNRFVLFSTPIAKGTTSALMSIISMCIQALGIEIANFLYSSHNNNLIGFYCAFIGLVYYLFLGATLYKYLAPNTEPYLEQLELKSS